MRSVPASLRAAAVLALASCGDGIAPPPFACTDEARASVSVTVLDSVSGAPLGRGVSVVLQDGAWVDSTLFGDAPFWDGMPLTTERAYERPGTYAVRVHRRGYASWTRNGVVVTQGPCHVNGVALTARLQRVP